MFELLAFPKLRARATATTNPYLGLLKHLGLDALAILLVVWLLGGPVAEIVNGVGPVAAGIVLVVLWALAVHVALVALTLVALTLRIFKRTRPVVERVVGRGSKTPAEDDASRLERLIAHSLVKGSDTLSDSDYGFLIAAAGRARAEVDEAEGAVNAARSNYRRVLDAYALHSADINARAKYGVTV